MLGEPRALEVFLELIAVPDHERPARLARACSDDPQLREAVRRLLEADRKSAGFLEPEIRVPYAGTFRPAYSSAEALIGRTVDGFLIESRIAEGGMGIVFQARQQHPPRPVALKIVRHSLALPQVAQRLAFEAEILGRLHHPHIAQVYAAGTIAGALGSVPYFAMELVEQAQSITAMSRAADLSVDERLQLFLDACDAVGHGHGRGVIHRDLKPSNILVDREGRVKVIDFGIARVISDESWQQTLTTHAGTLMGSLPYMAPEQCTGGAGLADARCDVYALGAILYELLCDEPVFDISTKSLEQALRAVREQPPRFPPPSNSAVNRDLQSIVLQALAKAPEQRYGSVSEFVADLERYRRREPVLASRPGAGRRLALFVERNPLATVLTLAIVLTLVGATLLSSRMYLRERSARLIADARRTEAESVTAFITDTLASVDPAEARGSEPTVRELLQAATRTIDRQLRNQPVAEARLREVIGTTYYHLGDNSIAEEQLRKSLRLTAAVFGNQSLEYASRAFALAAVLWNRHNYDEAAALLRQALAIRRTKFGRQHDETIDVASALATVLSDSGRDAEAEPLLREAIEAYRARYPDGNPVLARSLNALGTIMLHRGKAEQAEPLIREAVAMVESQLGADHPFTNITRMNYVNVLQALGKHEAALRALDQIMVALENLYGDEHMLVANCLEKRANSLRALGDEAASAESSARASAIREALSAVDARERGGATCAVDTNGDATGG